MVPVLPQVLDLDRRLRGALPLRSSGPGSDLRRRARRAAVAAYRAARHGEAARRAWVCRNRHAACAAALVRHAPSGARRRPARDPGIARPRLAFDNADLYGGRYASDCCRFIEARIRARELIYQANNKQPPLPLLRRQRPLSVRWARRGRPGGTRVWRARTKVRKSRNMTTSMAALARGMRKGQQEDRADHLGAGALSRVLRNLRQERADGGPGAEKSKPPISGIPCRRRPSAARGFTIVQGEAAQDRRADDCPEEGRGQGRARKSRIDKWDQDGGALSVRAEEAGGAQGDFSTFFLGKGARTDAARA